MKFRLYREFGALNSKEVFDAFEEGIKSLGHQLTYDSDGIPVIWSVLWNGRMANNQFVYEKCISQKKSVVIIEVGSFERGKTWKVSLNHINNQGIFGNKENLDNSRPAKLGLRLENFQSNRRPEILIACQHDKSLLWKSMPPLQTWVKDTVRQIRQFTDRKIIVRPHPRCLFSSPIPEIQFEIPKKVLNTYDSFDMEYNYHCVINHSSGPSIQAAINGTPIICDQSSLAFPVSDHFENIENLILKDRNQWLIELAHTEWTVDEIKKGIPLQRIFSLIDF